MQNLLTPGEQTKPPATQAAFISTILAYTKTNMAREKVDYDNI